MGKAAGQDYRSCNNRTGERTAADFVDTGNRFESVPIAIFLEGAKAR
jgi:hypothetical protein